MTSKKNGRRPQKEIEDDLRKPLIKMEDNLRKNYKKNKDKKKSKSFLDSS
jgi:hypothetical protein